MAIVTKITQPGNGQVSTLGGQIRIEQGNGRMLVFDGTVNRMIIGILPDGTIGFVVSKPGVEVLNVFN